MVHLHVISQHGILKHDTRVVAPWTTQVRFARSLDSRIVDNVPVGVVTGATRGGDVPVSNGLFTDISERSDDRRKTKMV